MDIKVAQEADREVLADIFMGHITENSEYISHGELQMGVGVAEKGDNGNIVLSPSPDGRRMWLKYISGKMCSDDAVVYKA
ncbi:MAG: hypothetical protein K2O58_01080, partial [Bacteroidales bacterium]|nr:hypothetical protein [Bacteroidales bacterium]